MHLPCTESTASNSMPSGKRHVTEILTWQRPCEVVHISGVQSSQRHTLQINIKTLAHMLLATLNVAQPVAISQTEWITSFRNYLQPLNCTPMCMHRHTKFLFNWPSFPELLQLWLRHQNRTFWDNWRWLYFLQARYPFHHPVNSVEVEQWST